MNLLKVLGACVKPAVLLYKHVVEQPQLEVTFGPPGAWEGSSIPISDIGNCSGGLQFTVRSNAKHPVELTGIKIAYKEPLQLTDPKRPAPDEHAPFFLAQFFKDRDFPYALGWEGAVTVGKNELQAFGAKVAFPDPDFVGEILLQITSNVKQKSFGGYLSKGRLHLTTWRYRVRLTSGRGSCLFIPSESSLESPQRFFDSLKDIVLVPTAREGNVHFRTFDANGKPVTTHYQIISESLPPIVRKKNK